VDDVELDALISQHESFCVLANRLKSVPKSSPQASRNLRDWLDEAMAVSPYGTSWHLMALPDRTKFSE
jgi:hypothetical protein